MLSRLNKSIGIAFLSVSSILFFVATIQAEPLPQSLVIDIKQRAAGLNTLTTDWLIDFQTTELPSPEFADPNKRAKLENEIAQDYKKQGIKDEKRIRSMASSAVNSLSVLGQSHHLNNKVHWIFMRNGQSTLVKGASPQGINITSYYTELYADGFGLSANDPYPANQHIETSFPAVWGTTQASTGSISPASDGLNLWPEEFTLLAGLNPLDMHNATWTLASVTPNAWTLTGKSLETSTSDPLTITLILSRKYGNAPQEILVKSNEEPWTQDYRVLEYQKYGNDWIGSHVELIARDADIPDVRESYILQKMEQSKPISVKLPSDPAVHDYRLLGNDLSLNDILTAEEQNSRKIVTYPWTGQFPSIEELRNLNKQQHPGEASPDPNGKSSMLPTVGGLLCLVGGLLAYRRRDKGAM